MRHASSRCTLEVYSQARILAKRQAQQRVVQMILPQSRSPRTLLACESQSRFGERDSPSDCNSVSWICHRYNDIGSYGAIWSNAEWKHGF